MLMCIEELTKWRQFMNYHFSSQSVSLRIQSKCEKNEVNCSVRSHTSIQLNLLVNFYFSPEQNRKQNHSLATCSVFSMNRSTVFSDTDWHKGITWNPGPECSHKEEKECGDTVDCWNGEHCCYCDFLFLSRLFALNRINELSLLYNRDGCDL